MRILIVQHDSGLADFWANFLEKQGATVLQALGKEEAIRNLRFSNFDAIVLEIDLPDGGAISISDYATYRKPDIPIIAVSRKSFFSDSTIFELIPNARSLMREPVHIGDLAAILEHYGSMPGTATDAGPVDATV